MQDHSDSEYNEFDRSFPIRKSFLDAHTSTQADRHCLRPPTINSPANLQLRGDQMVSHPPSTHETEGDSTQGSSVSGNLRVQLGVSPKGSRYGKVQSPRICERTMRASTRLDILSLSFEEPTQAFIHDQITSG